MVRFPEGFRLARLEKRHPRSAFSSGEPEVDAWLATRALQHQLKHLSVTRLLLDGDDRIAAFFTLATAQVDFGGLPASISKGLPKRALPVAVLAWLGVAGERQGAGLGKLIFARALLDCYEAGKTFAFVAVIIDCLNDRAKAFYRNWDFEELPGHPYRLYLSATLLAELAEG